MRILLSLLAFLAFGLASGNIHPHHRDNIEKVKKYFARKARFHGAGAKWEAGENHLTEKDPEELKNLCGAIPMSRAKARSDYHPAPPIPSNKQRITIDPQFDAATKWPNCPSIKKARDQGACGSCWAFAGAATLSDRYCIASGQTKTKTFSPQDLLVCSGGQDKNYCYGNLPRAPFIMAVTSGVVSGGDYQSGAGCLPYTSYTTAAAINTSTSQCNKKCSANGLSYAQDLAYASTWYEIGNFYVDNKLAGGGAAANVSNLTVVQQIQYELQTRGPISVIIKVYNDFFAYKSGVYQHVTGDYAGYHSLKLIGWGTESGTDYWLTVNSWGPNWGMNGTVKILRGVNHLEIENYVVTAMMDPQLTQPVSVSGTCNLAGCAGKALYPLAPANVCSSSYCACGYFIGLWNAAKNGWDWTQSPQVIGCAAGQAFDATGSVQACVDKKLLPACGASG